MSNSLSSLLRETVERELPVLQQLTEEQSLLPRGEGKWCPREELGHLIDSAANNQQRFVRAALDGTYIGPGYSADDWVRLHGYRNMSWGTLVEFWFQYNVLLSEVLARISGERLETPCTIGAYPQVTLHFVAEDYILHLRHHIDLLLQRSEVTRYLSAP